jgi:hypothetical protein
MCFQTEAAISEEAWYVAVGERRDGGRRDESRVFAMDRWSSHGSRCRAARRSRRRRLSRRADNRSGIRAAAVFRMVAARGVARLVDAGAEPSNDVCGGNPIVPALVGLALEMEMAIQGLDLGRDGVQVERRNKMITIKIYDAIPFDCV